MPKQNPDANVPRQADEEPLGDRSQGDRTWTPPAGEQGISNREGDAGDEPGPDSDPASFGHDDKDVVALVEEEPSDDDAADDDGDQERDDDDEA